MIDAMGNPLGSAPTVLVSGSTPVYQPAVAYNAAYNQYLVVWMRNSNLDGKTYDVWGKILSASLTEVRPEYQIFHVDGSGCWTPRVAWNSKKNEYMVAWNAFDISTFPSIYPTDIAEASLYDNGDIIAPGALTIIYNQPPDNMIYPQQVDLVYFPTGDP